MSGKNSADFLIEVCKFGNDNNKLFCNLEDDFF